jgi:hypothetical protein
VERFRVDCQRVATILYWGGDLNYVFDDLPQAGIGNRSAGTTAKRSMPANDVTLQAGSSGTKGKQREVGVGQKQKSSKGKQREVGIGQKQGTFKGRSEGQVKERTPARVLESAGSAPRRAERHQGRHGKATDRQGSKLFDAAV